MQNRRNRSKPKRAIKEEKLDTGFPRAKVSAVGVKAGETETEALL